MRVIAVIVTFNSASVIEVCLRGLVREKVDQIIVVDNNSTDNTVTLVKKRFPKVEILQLRQNLGYAGGNNQGIEVALKSNPDYVLILNPDTQVLKDSVEKLIQAAKERNSNGVFGPVIYKVRDADADSRLSLPQTKLWGGNNRRVIWSRGGELDKKRWTAKLIGYDIDENVTSRLPATAHRSKINRCDFISGTCMLIPRGLLETRLRFYEPYFMYYEDVEFCVSAAKLGYPAIVIPEAQIIHYETSGKVTGAKLFHLTGGRIGKNYYLARNHLLFVERNAPVQVKLRELVRLPKTCFDHARGGDFAALKGISDYFLRRFNKYG